MARGHLVSVAQSVVGHYAVWVLAGSLLFSGGPTPQGPHRIPTMGTAAEVTIFPAEDLDQGYALAARRFAAVDSLMSNWTTTSETARLNLEAYPGPTPVHDQVWDVIQRGMRVGQESSGAFDLTVEPLVRAWGFLSGTPRVPAPQALAEAQVLVGSEKLRLNADSQTIQFSVRGMRIDLGGIAKGYAVDQVAQDWTTHGIHRGLINLSGNLRALGKPDGRDSWNIGIRDPRGRSPYFAALSISDECMATSGNYEQFVDQDGIRYGHILDPRTGYPAQGLIGVTVIAPTAMEADAWGTALFVLGPARAKALASTRDDLHVLLIQPGSSPTDSDPSTPDTVWVESTLLPRLRMLPTVEDQFVVLSF